MLTDAFLKIVVPILTVVLILGAIFKDRIPVAAVSPDPKKTAQSKTGPVLILLCFVGIHIVLMLEVARYVSVTATRIIVDVLLALPVYTMCAVVVGVYSFIMHKLKGNQS